MSDQHAKVTVDQLQAMTAAGWTPRRQHVVTALRAIGAAANKVPREWRGTESHLAGRLAEIVPWTPARIRDELRALRAAKTFYIRPIDQVPCLVLDWGKLTAQGQVDRTESTSEVDRTGSKVDRSGSTPSRLPGASQPESAALRHSFHSPHVDAKNGAEPENEPFEPTPVVSDPCGNGMNGLASLAVRDRGEGLVPPRLVVHPGKNRVSGRISARSTLKRSKKCAVDGCDNDAHTGWFLTGYREHDTYGRVVCDECKQKLYGSDGRPRSLDQIDKISAYTDLMRDVEAIWAEQKERERDSIIQNPSNWPYERAVEHIRRFYASEPAEKAERWIARNEIDQRPEYNRADFFEETALI